jgi:hypothetical protein
MQILTDGDKFGEENDSMDFYTVNKRWLRDRLSKPVTYDNSTRYVRAPKSAYANFSTEWPRKQQDKKDDRREILGQNRTPWGDLYMRDKVPEYSMYTPELRGLLWNPSERYGHNAAFSYKCAMRAHAAQYITGKPSIYGQMAHRYAL